MQQTDSSGSLLAKDPRLPDLIQRFLRNRGFSDAQAIEALLNPKLKDLTHPLQLDGMDLALARLVRAHEAQEKLAIYADFDLDGTSGAALLNDCFAQMGFQNRVLMQPTRLTDGYGFHPHLVDELSQQGVRLIVTVDVGITAREAVARATELGIDVIITDHHLPEGELPQALAVINPNKGSCSSQLGHLCGAGVAFYLAMAVKLGLERAGRLTQEPNLKSVLDCLAIGTLTDMVPLVKENRVLVKHGLVRLKETTRPGLRALLRALGMDGRALSSADVAIRFAPKLNALSRMERGLRPLDVFCAPDMNTAEAMIAEILDCNELRVKLQRQAEEHARSLVDSQCSDRFVWVYSDQFHRGVVGLIATRLSQEFAVPTFVGALQADGSIVGSGRLEGSVDANLLEILQSSSAYLERFGGHQRACGFELNQEKASLWHQHLSSTLENPKPLELSSGSESHCEARVDELTTELLTWLDRLGPFGMGFEAPKFRIALAEVVSLRKMGKDQKHLKLELRDPDGSFRAEAVWFSVPSQHPVMLGGIEPGRRLDVLVEPQWNHFMGRQSVQLLVEEVRFA